MKRTLVAGFAAAVAALAADGSFVHPGLLHSKGDLDRMKVAVERKQQPIYAGYGLLHVHLQSQADYKMLGPMEEVGRNPTIGQREFDNDANAAYQNAIEWAITGETAHAAKAKEILNAWASTLKRITGADAVLMAGLGPFKMLNAAEILRYTGAGWGEDETKQFERFCREVVYPVLKDFAPFANGNWDTAAIKTILAIGVFTNDRHMFEKALRYYVNGTGDGRLTHYIYSNGQCQESGRDQAHTQLGLAHLGDAAEIAWNQGLDLYSYAGNRLLAGFEYTAKYNLGLEVPFEPDLDRTGKYAHSAISPRGPLRPVFEQIYNHYVNRVGLDAPFTRKAAEQIRPEGAAQGADHPGFGTVLFSARKGDAAPMPVAPGGLVAQSLDGGIRLTWISARGAAGYTVKRSVLPGGPPLVIASGVRGTEYIDRTMRAGSTYSYSVSDSVAVGICAGLPAGWSPPDMGAGFDGTTFTMEAGAGDARSVLLKQSRSSRPAITARFVPPVSSQSLKAGVGMRAAGVEVELRVGSVSGGDRERPEWRAVMYLHQDGQAETQVGAATLGAPYIAWGRLVAPCWLRLAKAGNDVTGYLSPDNATWTPLGIARLAGSGNIVVELAADSGLPKLTTTVNFDHVTVQ